MTNPLHGMFCIGTSIVAKNRASYLTAYFQYVGISGHDQGGLFCVFYAYFTCSVVHLPCLGLLCSEGLPERGTAHKSKRIKSKWQQRKSKKPPSFTEGGFLAFPSGFEPLTYRLGVDSEPPNCLKIGIFLANRALFCVFCVYFSLFFAFQTVIFISFSNFYAKNYAKTMLFWN